MKYIKIFIISLAIIGSFSCVSFAKAAEVNLSIEVLPRKLTDTMNDFDLSNVNSIYVKPIINTGTVKGASTSSAEDKGSIFVRVITFIENLATNTYYAVASRIGNAMVLARK